MSNCSVEKLENLAFGYYPRLTRVDSFCRSHLTEDISLQMAADVAGLERSYFSTYFKKKTGVCFNFWLALRRVEAAKSLLSNRDRSISGVAQEVGFNNLETFERSFKRCFDMTPSQYKKTVRPC